MAVIEILLILEGKSIILIRLNVASKEFSLFIIIIITLNN